MLSQYDFKIIYCKGNNNRRADALSQQPDYEEKSKKADPAILRENKDGTINYNHQILAATINIRTMMMTKLINETWKDKTIQEMVENRKENEKLSKDEKGLVYMHNLIYMPKSMRNEIIWMHHNQPMFGHLGNKKTMEQIAQNYYFLNIWQAVIHYVKNCEMCMRNKLTRHPPFGKLQSANAPSRPWQWIMIDFITQLPESEGYDSIQVITDQLTKYINLTPVTGTMTAEEMAHQLLWRVITNHEMPETITSDWDKLFTSKF